MQAATLRVLDLAGAKGVTPRGAPLQTLQALADKGLCSSDPPPAAYPRRRLYTINLRGIERVRALPPVTA